MERDEDVGGADVAEAAGTAGAECLWGAREAFPVAPGEEEAKRESPGNPHSTPSRRLGCAYTDQSPQCELL